MKRNIHPFLYSLSLVFLTLLAGSCSSDASFSTKASQPSTTGQAGSLARFAVVDNYLYVVDIDGLKQYDISEQPKMTFVRDVPMENGVETIFAKPPYLFIGTQTGLYTYEISSNGGLDFVSHYAHIISCDPVVADDRYAYVTLRSGNAGCQGWASINQLQIISIEDITRPQNIMNYDMSFPKGLGIDDGTLFICDDNHLKIYNAADPYNLLPIKEFQDIKPNDIIPLGDLALVISSTSLYQYDYSDLNNIFLVSQFGLD